MIILSDVYYEPMRQLDRLICCLSLDQGPWGEFISQQIVRRRLVCHAQSEYQSTDLAYEYVSQIPTKLGYANVNGQWDIGRVLVIYNLLNYLTPSFSISA